MTKFMTKAEREKVSNRLVLNFGILLAGALIMLYVWNFISAGYVRQAQNVCGVAAIIAAVTAIVLFVVGNVKKNALKKYSAVPLGVMVAGAIVYLPYLLAPKFAFVTPKNAVITVFILMLVYFVVMAIVTGVILKKHPEAPTEKKKIQHAKKKNKRK